MSNNIRDRQFINFAHALHMECATIHQEELIKGSIDADQCVIQNIARRAYDLVCHSVDNLDDDVAWRIGKGYTVSQIVENDISDMTEWPDEGEK